MKSPAELREEMGIAPDMELTPEAKAAIDAMSFEDMLERVRFEPQGSAFFRMGTDYGAYTWKKWEQLSKDTPQADKVRASKLIGWAR